MKNIEQLAKEYIIVAKAQIQEHEEIKTLLVHLEGKALDYRTFNKKRLGRFKFEQKYGMAYIVGNCEHLVGHMTDPFVDSEAFEKFDACYGSANQEMIEKLERIDKEELQQTQNTIAQAFETIKSQFAILQKEKLDSYNNPIYYEMLQEIHNENKAPAHCRIVLSDFHYLINK